MGLGTDGSPSILSLTIITTIILHLGPIGVAPLEELCHPSCFCLDTFFDCQKRGLSKFPTDFPTWVEKLNLTGNELSSVDISSVSRLPKLEALSLDSNKFTTVPNLGNLPQLLHLSLAKNEIQTVSDADIKGLINLEELDLSKNSIDALSNSSFPYGTSLQFLNLGFNQIEVLLPGWLAPLKNLMELNLAKNKLKNLSKESLTALKRLDKLDLSRNKLDMIDSLRFQELKNLKHLNLRRNLLSNFSDAVFFGLDRLQQLHLDGNSVKCIEKRWLYGLPALKVFNVSRNQVTTIEDGSWEFIQELQVLDMSHNKLERINKKSFFGLDELKELDLSNNLLSGIDEESFVSLAKLDKLDLSNNDLSWVLEDTSNIFQGLRECQYLNLASNKIRSLHPSALVGLAKLTNLNLSTNPILWLSEKAFSDIPNLSIIMFGVETLVCDCNALWLRSRLSEQTGKPKGRPRDFEKFSSKKFAKKRSAGIVRCALPESLFNRSLVEISPGDLVCAENSLRPEFIEEPKQEIFLMEGNGTLSCKTLSFANHTLVWWKDREELPKQLASEVVNMYRLQDNGATVIHSTLQLLNVSWNLAGSYQCVAENSYGVVYSAKANVTVHIFPTFIKKPSNVTVRLGSNAKLECAAKGFPTPEIAFQKDGGEDFPAALDRRFHVMPNDDSFFIMEVKVSDMGVYCCSARNSAGEVKAYASVTVYDTPSFSDPMKDESVVEGSNALLACIANGSPKPSISWSKDGASITEAKDKRYHLSENGSLLIIKDAQTQDAGRYECQLSNAVGATRGYSTLTVLPSSSGRGHLDTSAMTIIFIIIAVFCVVGTSAAWVVVIYRTKKRNASAEARNPNYDDDRPKSVLFDNITQFNPNCTVTTTLCPEIDSQSIRGNDYATDNPEADPMAIIEAEHESFIRRGRRRDIDSFSTFGTRASSSRMSQVRLDLHDSNDVISLSHHPGREFLTTRKIKKVAVPSPPDKDGNGKRRSTCHSNSSSSGYSSCGIRVCQGEVEYTKQSGSINSQSEDLESLQDSSIDKNISISTPV